MKRPEIPERGPSLPLDALEEAFGKVAKRWRKARPPAWLRLQQRHPENRVRFEDLAVGLGAVASAFAARRVPVRAAERSGGPVPEAVLVPAHLALAPSAEANREWFYMRAALGGLMLADANSEESAFSAAEPAWLAHTKRIALDYADQSEEFAERLRRCARQEFEARWAITPRGGLLSELELLRRSTLEDLMGHRGRPGAQQRFPARSLSQTLRRRKAFDAGPLWTLGGPIPPSEHDALLAQIAQESASGQSAESVEHEGRLRDHARQTSVEEDPYKDNMPSHSFEKIDFAEKYDGGLRRMDGVDDLEEQGDSLDEVDLREMLRGGPEVAAVYRVDGIGPGEIPDVHGVGPTERGISYDEWDGKRKTYRRAWVTLFPTHFPASLPTLAPAPAEWREGLANSVRRSIAGLEKLRNQRLARGRQLEGEDIDLDELIDEYAQRRMGHTPPGRYFVQHPKLERDIATLVLIDVSDSADSYVDNLRVLDTELAATFVVGEVAHHFGDPLAILAFASHTRNLCRAWSIKDWDESWPKVKQRLDHLKPQGYTRIGPALRHATARLLDHPAQTKHLIVITDGKPTDFDRYEGGYGIQDVAKAVQEARAARIQVQAIGIDPKSARSMPAMFGPGGWRLLRRLSELPEALIQAFG